MTLNAPTKIVFLISLVVAIIAIIALFNILPTLPIPAFWLMTLAYVVLMLACMVKGL
ncbi:hypothetical protein [Chelativorans sp. M5D2P16]|uniref:hypothetical protein n=1 Tax=Chelativorans sp. M5D2P16 TaxID=3095678 RepID=UPI002ACAA3D2|nr:hypothetical protein [Chelativorans sp. M5D2P16]MDZ5698258.1 hypothetical protein [Chelativorans sp. M5D2P16]